MDEYYQQRSDSVIELESFITVIILLIILPPSRYGNILSGNIKRITPTIQILICKSNIKFKCNKNFRKPSATQYKV